MADIPEPEYSIRITARLLIITADHQCQLPSENMSGIFFSVYFHNNFLSSLRTKTRGRCRKVDGRPLYVSLKIYAVCSANMMSGAKGTLPLTLYLNIILRCRHGSCLFFPEYQAVHHLRIQPYHQLLQVYASVLLRLLSGKGFQSCILL